jgi:GntP family gluconate:H+ symporter
LQGYHFRRLILTGFGLIVVLIIAIVIILGALVGTVNEATGAAFKLADMVIKLVGKKNTVLAVQLMGWVVSIPVFCASGFAILAPIRKALVKKTRVSSVSMTIGLSLCQVLKQVGTI